MLTAITDQPGELDRTILWSTSLHTKELSHCRLHLSAFPLPPTVPLVLSKVVTSLNSVTISGPRSKSVSGRIETMFDYSGSTALVTGASKGLGEAFAEALAARGMNLVLVARSTKKLNDLSARLNAKYKIQCTVLSVDLADPNSPRALAEELEHSGI